MPSKRKTVPTANRISTVARGAHVVVMRFNINAPFNLQLWRGVEPDDGHLRLLWNLKSQKELARCQMAGVAAIQHLFVGLDESCAVLRLYGVSNLLQRG